MKPALVVGVLMLAASPAAVQAQAESDSAALAATRALLFSVREAVDRVSAHSNEFRRDLRTVGELTVLARAKRLEAACRDARAVLTDARPRLASARLAPRQVGARDSLATAIGTLAMSLQRECERGLGPEGPGSRADTLRAWGPHRTSILSQAISRYHGAAGRFARRLGIDLSKR